MRHKPNLRYTARGRPQSWQRRRNFVENLGFCLAFAILAVLAMDIGGLVSGVLVPSRLVSGICHCLDQAPRHPGT